MRNYGVNSIQSTQAASWSARVCWAAGLLLSSAVTLTAQDPNTVRRRIEIQPSANPYPDANERTRMLQAHKSELAFDAANAERKREIAQEAAILLRLASELKTALDGSDPHEMAVAGRKAELIERLARDVQAKMKLTVYTR